MPKAKRPLQRGEPEALLRKAITAREKALVVLLWRGGLRSNEACNVRCEDFEIQRDKTIKLHIVVGKGGKQRHIGFGHVYAKYIRKQLSGRKTGYFLCTRHGTPIITQQVRRTIHFLGQRANIADRVHPHKLRHCYARDLHDEEYSVEEIRLALGHNNLGTTQIYLESIGLDAVVDKLTTRD